MNLWVIRIQAKQPDFWLKDNKRKGVMCLLKFRVGWVGVMQTDRCRTQPCQRRPQKRRRIYQHDFD